MRKAIALGLALVALAAACGGDDDEDEAAEATTALTETTATETDDDDDGLGTEVVVELQEQNDSGITGEAQLSPTSDGQVEVEIELDGSEGGPHPAHIHEGSCDDLDPTPAFPLTDVVDGESSTTIDVEIQDLGATEYAINVHESPENAQVYVACGDLDDLGIG